MLSRLVSLFFILALASHAFAQDEKWKAWEVEADTLLNQQKFKEAIKLYSNVISATPEEEIAHYKAIYKRAVAYYSIEDFQSALKDLDVFIPKFSDSPQAHILRALIYRELGDAERQLIDLEEAIDLQNDPSLIKWRATVLMDLGKLDQAKKDLLLIRGIQDDPELEAQLGYVYYSQHQSDSALMSLNKAIELEPTYLPAYYYAGSFCLQDEEYQLGLKYLDVALKIEPGNATVLFYKGIALVELDKKDLGCRFLKKAFDAGEDDAGDYLKEYCYEANK